MASGQLLLLNPSRRKSRKTRSAAQKRATAKMLAANRARRGGAVKAKRRVSRKPRAVAAYAANPVKRRTRRIGTRVAKRASHRRYKRNPIGLPKLGGLMSMITDAAIAGGGAIGVDLAMGKLAPHLPANMKGKYDADGSINYYYAATKVALAVALGALLPKALPGKFKKYARDAAMGSLTVQAYDIIKHAVPTTMTLGYMQPAALADNSNVVNMGAYLNGLRGNGVGAYLEGTGAGSADPLYMPDQRVGEGTVL